jgi:hypothetical protein
MPQTWIPNMRALILLFMFFSATQSFAKDVAGTYPAGIVYGPKAAFQISAPNGWVLDNHSGISDGQPCVLYPVGESWAKSPTIMYAKIASPNYPTKSEFIKYTVAFFQSKDAGFRFRNIEEAKTKEGYQYTVQEYDRPSYPVYELTAYVQLPGAVAYIVYSAPKESLRETDMTKFKAVLSSMVYRPEYIQK